MNLSDSAFKQKNNRSNRSSLRPPNQPFAGGYQVSAPEYSVWNFKLVHYPNDVQIDFYKILVKLDIWRKPSQQRKVQKYFLEGKLIMRTKPSKNCTINTRLIMLDVSFLRGFAQLDACFLASLLILRGRKSSLEDSATNGKAFFTQGKASHWTRPKEAFQPCNPSNQVMSPCAFWLAAFEDLMKLIFVA